LKLQILRCKSTKFVCEFCGLDALGILSLVDTATLSCFNHDLLWIFTRAPCLFNGTYSSQKIFMNLYQGIFKQPTHTFDWLQSPLIIMILTQATTHCCLEPFQCESLWRWDLGHNLLLSEAFRWESLWRWDLGHNLLSQAFRWESLWRWDLGFHGAFFTNSSSFHNRILAIRKPFTQKFFLLQWNLGYHEALFTNFSFTMEYRLSRSPFHEFFLHNGIPWSPFYEFFFHDRI
jgi:hypothetical protein